MILIRLTGWRAVAFLAMLLAGAIYWNYSLGKSLKADPAVRAQVLQSLRFRLSNAATADLDSSSGSMTRERAQQLEDRLRAIENVEIIEVNSGHFLSMGWARVKYRLRERNGSITNGEEEIHLRWRWLTGWSFSRV